MPSHEREAENENENANSNEAPKLSFAQKWAGALQTVRLPVRSALCKIALTSSRNPWTTIIIALFFAIAFPVIGMFTNLNFESDDDILFTPFGALPTAHQDWINEESDFPPIFRDHNVLLHRNGDNILEDCRDSIEKSFQVWETLSSLKKFEKVCGTSFECPWSSVTQFFNNSREMYEAANFQSNQDCIEALSAPVFPNGEVVLFDKLFGRPVKNDTTGLLINSQATFHILGLPLDENLLDTTEEMEEAGSDALFTLYDSWKPTQVVLEQINESSFPTEFGNGFVENIPLLAASFTIMILFTALFFFRCDAMKSRVAVGLGAVSTVMFGIGTGFGIMFCTGVPITSIHGILPFILVGIGLDDAFIITAEFYRLPLSLSTEERVVQTIEEVGLSILTTTVTSAVAFGLGCISTIPAVFWVCLYAFPAILFKLVFFMTYFIAILALDEKRVTESRRDVFCCCALKKEEPASDLSMEDASVPEIEQDRKNGSMQEEINEQASEIDEIEPYVIDRLMTRYADLLMKPVVKAVIIVFFGSFFAACAYSTSLLEQEFTVGLVLPEGSYVVSFLDSLQAYTTNGEFEGTLFFRDLDQSSLENQEKMEKYVNDMVALESISAQPDFFWLRDFQDFTRNSSAFDGLSFEDQIDIFLSVPAYHALYNDNIARNGKGEVTASRVLVKYDQVKEDDVTGQTDALADQERIAKKQSINKGLDGEDWSFFSFDDIYFIWEFYTACPEELTLSTVVGVIAVSFISLLAIPHWSAVLFSAPLIIVLYIDLLGILQFFGITVNSISYITLTVSIGLMVDFLIHILLSYFESNEITRAEKVKQSLKTMGVSVAVGGFTTFLGVLPLVFNTTGIFEVVFVTFLALVILGMTHGLILLPVLLSIFGPENNVALIRDENFLEKANIEVQVDEQ